MKTVVILTQPRSGSSLLAGILERLGVWMGPEEDMIKGKHKNKYGSYENHAFLKLNHRILFRAKRLTFYWNRFSDDDGKVEEAVKYYEKDLVKLIHESERELWGFKEAVIIYSLPYFHHHLKNPYYIYLYRDPASVANSQRRAGKLKNWIPEIWTEFSYFKPRERFILAMRTLKGAFVKGFPYRNRKFLEKLTANAQERIEAFVKDKKYLKLDLSEIIEQPKETVKKLIDFLEISPTKEQIAAAIDFVKPELITSQINNPNKQKTANRKINSKETAM